jgi:hypothetical protein
MRVACGQRKQGNLLEISNESFSPRLKAKQSARRNSLFWAASTPSSSELKNPQHNRPSKYCPQGLKSNPR